MSDENNSVSKDPDFSQYFDLFDQLFGTGTSQTLLSSIEQNFGQLLTSPQAFLEDLQRMLGEKLINSPLDLNVLANCIPLLMSLRKNSLSERQKRIDNNESAKALLDFLNGSIQILGVENVASYLPQADHMSVTKLLARNLGPIISDLITEAEKFEQRARFEEWTKAISGHLYNLAESEYKQQLVAVLKISRLRLQRSTDIPNELGSVMGQCRDLWKNHFPQLLLLLLDEIRVIRNSEAHLHTQLDLSNLTVTYFNYPKKGKPEQLGPLDVKQLQDMVELFAKLYMLISDAFFVVSFS